MAEEQRVEQQAEQQDADDSELRVHRERMEMLVEAIHASRMAWAVWRARSQGMFFEPHEKVH